MHDSWPFTHNDRKYCVQIHEGSRVFPKRRISVVARPDGRDPGAATRNQTHAVLR